MSAWGKVDTDRLKFKSSSSALKILRKVPVISEDLRGWSKDVSVTADQQLLVVYHLPQILENFDRDVNGKRFFWFVPLEISRDKRKFWKGSPVFPIGTFPVEIRLQFTSFLSFVPVSCYN